jgi:hypothetical protein
LQNIWKDLNHLGIRIENSDKNQKTVYKLNLLDLNNPNMLTSVLNCDIARCFACRSATSWPAQSSTCLHCRPCSRSSATWRSSYRSQLLQDL